MYMSDSLHITPKSSATQSQVIEEGEKIIDGILSSINVRQKRKRCKLRRDWFKKIKDDNDTNSHSLMLRKLISIL